ncbi:MAG: enoyl-CoA hydratase/isomerase family protein [Deltaproteobacteria bacterium]|nr:enoyl-CoA hydratase/isomerase family protein [Deltaproteobacteria bacterium]
MSGGFILTESADGIGVIRFNRPEVRNALNRETVSQFRRALNEMAADDAIQVIIITGAGDKAFVAGADIKELRERSAADALGYANQDIFNEVERCPKPTIAAVNGFALGGGCELAMCCDIRIASATARFGQPEVNLGIIPGAGGTQRLPRLVGKGRAKEMILTGEIIDAEKAEHIGLVNRVVPPDRLMEESRETARTIMGKGPLAVRLAKWAIDQGLETDLNSGLALEKSCFALLMKSEDKIEGTSAFLEKRKPRFTGR